ncbi:MAG: hypothetical protein KGM17_07735 [Sphingomonadales bacterium]|nr:hypothetical protein [Sphingomonadales bacterium]
MLTRLSLGRLSLLALAMPVAAGAQPVTPITATTGAATTGAARSGETIPSAAPGQAPAGSVGGMGDINLYPKRVVISDRERTASIGLYNRAAATGDYDITLGDMMMTPEGRLVDLASVSDPALRAKVQSASGLLKWSPHRVTLPANEAQMVRIMARVPPGLAPGEYRTHFSAVAVPPESGELSIEQAAGATQGNSVGVRIVPRFGISIPVIVRVGETTLTVGLEGLQVARMPGGPVFVFRVTRSGTRSAFGDISVTAPGTKKPLAEIRGIGVYTEIGARTVQVPIDPKADPRSYAPGAKVTVSYVDDDFAPGRTLARQDFIVP